MTAATFLDNGYFVPSDPNAADDHGGRLGTTPADPDRVYVALIGKGKASDTGWIGLYRSNDRGDLWTNPNGQDGAPYDVDVHPSLATGNMNGTGIYQGFYDFAMAVSHEDADRVWVGGTPRRHGEAADVGPHRGRRGWGGRHRVGAPGHPDLHVLGRMWVASDGGLNHSTDELTTHTSRNTAFTTPPLGLPERTRRPNRRTVPSTATQPTVRTSARVFHLAGGAEAPTGYVNPLDADELRFSDIGDLRLGSGFDDAFKGIGNPAMYPTESYVDSRSRAGPRPAVRGPSGVGNGSGSHRSFDGGASFELLMISGAAPCWRSSRGGATATCSPSPARVVLHVHRSLTAQLVNCHGSPTGRA